ncbi:MAG: type I restriction enzyme HsdR N-terminal domain-containing protein [Brevundimonas sp.]|nr:MAG: type I restriction enzyme HsdR N-terminal domain-containing protein [Brevundimonas sp.]
MRSLGYRTGSENNIIREGQLRHDFLCLGRKTKNDMRLIGRPDYLLEIGGHGTILIEAKAGDRSLSNETVEQAKSYAIHPEVAATAFVITNGLDFLVFSSSGQEPG